MPIEDYAQAVEGLYAPSSKRFRRTSEQFLGPRQAALTRAAQVQALAPEAAAPAVRAPGGILRGADLGRRAERQAARSVGYGGLMGRQVGEGLAERASAQQLFARQQDQARRRFEESQARAAQQGMRLAGAMTEQGIATAQRYHKDPVNRREAEFNKLYSAAVAQGSSPDEAYLFAYETTGYDPLR